MIINQSLLDNHAVWLTHALWLLGSFSYYFDALLLILIPNLFWIQMMIVILCLLIKLLDVWYLIFILNTDDANFLLLAYLTIPCRFQHFDELLIILTLNIDKEDFLLFAYQAILSSYFYIRIFRKEVQIL